MKLSEVIKAIEDGSKSEFKSDLFKIEADIVHGELGVKISTDYDAFHFPVLWWEEIKPPRQWSEKELMLFKLLPDWAKWIASDFEDGPFVFENEPLLIGNDFDWKLITGSSESLMAFEHLIKMEVGEKQYIVDMKGE